MYFDSLTPTSSERKTFLRGAPTMRPMPDPSPNDTPDASARAAGALTEAMRLLDRALAPRQKVQAFRRAAEVVATLDPDELAARVSAGTLTELDGIGPSTGSVIAAAVSGAAPTYLSELEAGTRIDPGVGAPVLERLRGDCHSHTTWSDGGASLDEMAHAAMALCHEYLVVTDHSPRLTVAHGLSPERLARQLEEIERLNHDLAPFRLLTGMEVDILVDGTLDLADELLAELDVVVASVHSKLSMPEDQMTRRMVMAAANPHVDILGHCTGRKVVGGGRPQSKFDPDYVFAACAQFGTAVEINCRPERQDPPEELLAAALRWGCHISIDTDAHAPGQLEWLPYGADKAVRCEVPVEQIINTWAADELLEWTTTHPG
jgi:putative hydrolase